MHPPPNPEMRRAGAASNSTHPKIAISSSNIDSAASAADFQARKLRRLFFLTPDTACTIASLAFGRVSR